MSESSFAAEFIRVIRRLSSRVAEIDGERGGNGRIRPPPRAHAECRELLFYVALLPLSLAPHVQSAQQGVHSGGRTTFKLIPINTIFGNNFSDLILRRSSFSNSMESIDEILPFPRLLEHLFRAIQSRTHHHEVG